MIYIFDIDGTLADISHRLHFIKDKPADWRSFFKACPADSPIPEIIRVAQSLSYHPVPPLILMVSGRSEEIRMETVAWMEKHKIPCDGLYMREDGDHREDNIVKAELLDDLLDHWRGHEVAGVFEDRKQVVDMYRAKGLRVFQVAEGNF